MGERAPQHIQNIIVRNYCERIDSIYLLSAVEYAMPKSSLVLSELLSENNVDGIVMYSIFQLPENTSERKLVYKEIIDRNKELHFAVEGIRLTNLGEINRVELIWRLRLMVDSNTVNV